VAAVVAAAVSFAERASFGLDSVFVRGWLALSEADWLAAKAPREPEPTLPDAPDAPDAPARTEEATRADARNAQQEGEARAGGWR
jgi:hypothetical protein